MGDRIKTGWDALAFAERLGLRFVLYLIALTGLAGLAAPYREGDISRERLAQVVCATVALAGLAASSGGNRV